MINLLKKIDIGFLLYFGTLIYAIFFATRFFETNDDMLMMLIASGLFTGEPSEYIVFQNIVVGLFLKQLYLISPDIHWYMVFLTLVQSLAFSAIYFLTLPFLNKLTRTALFVLPLLYFLFEFNIYLQFTKVAFLSSTVGILYIIKYMSEQKNTYLFYSFVFLLLGFLIREHALYGTFLTALPVLIFFYFKYRPSIKINIKHISFILLLIVITFFSKTYDNTYYLNNSNNEWKNYKELIMTRGAIYRDRSITKECFETNAKEFGLTHNDIASYYKWTNDSNEIYTVKMISHVTQKCAKQTSEKYEKIFHVNYWKNFFMKLQSFSSVFILLLSFYLIFLFEKKYRYLLVLYTLFFISILMYLFTTAFDNRVVSSLLLEYYILLIFSYMHVKTQQINVKTPVIVLLIIIGLLISYLYIFEKTIDRKSSFPIEKELSTLKGNYVIVAKSKNFFESLTLDTDFKTLFHDTKFYYIGWNLGSPDTAKILDEKSSNFYELLLNKPNVILYTDTHRIPVIQTFIQEHYGKKVTFKNIKNNYYKLDSVEDVKTPLIR